MTLSSQMFPLCADMMPIFTKGTFLSVDDLDEHPSIVQRCRQMKNANYFTTPIAVQ